MSELIEKLRCYSGTTVLAPYVSLMRDAADELERQAAEYNKLDRQFDAYIQETANSKAALMTEIVTLRGEVIIELR